MFANGRLSPIFLTFCALIGFSSETIAQGCGEFASISGRITSLHSDVLNGQQGNTIAYNSDGKLSVIRITKNAATPAFEPVFTIPVGSELIQLVSLN